MFPQPNPDGEDAVAVAAEAKVMTTAVASPSPSSSSSYSHPAQPTSEEHHRSVPDHDDRGENDCNSLPSTIHLQQRSLTRGSGPRRQPPGHSPSSSVSSLFSTPDPADNDPSDTRRGGDKSEDLVLVGVVVQEDGARQPPLRVRRSVTSMRALLPLALPTTASPTSPTFSFPAKPVQHAATADEEDLNSTEEDSPNLPELLARDLELSSALFESKHLSAGTPSFSLDQSAETQATSFLSRFNQDLALSLQQLRADGPKSPGGSRSSRVPSPSPSASPTPTPTPTPGLTTRLPTLDESQDDGDDDDDKTEAPSDNESLKGSSSSSSVPETLQAHPRELRSVITAATSMTSGSGDKTPPSPDRSIWIENDSDGCLSDHKVSPTVSPKVKIPVRLPSMSVEADEEPYVAETRMGMDVSRPNTMFSNPWDEPTLDGRTTSLTRGRTSRSPSKPPSRIPSSGPSANGREVTREAMDVFIPKRRSSLSHRVSASDVGPQVPGRNLVDGSSYNQSAAGSTVGSRPTSMWYPPTTNMERSIAWISHTPQPQSPPRMSDFFFPDRRGFSGSGTTSSPSDTSGPPRKHNSMIVHRVSQPIALFDVLPHDNVQTWLDTSVPMTHYPVRSTGEHSPASPQRGMPLPPEVVETLRVSIACFPETMLLSSSLSIETIRNYGRKMRRPPMDPVDPRREKSSPASSVRQQHRQSQHGGRRWNWSRVLSSSGMGKKTASSPVQTRNSSSSRSTLQPTNVLGGSECRASFPPTSYLTLKNIFGPSASDYLCDALYAHVIAYNYISTLVVRPPQPPPPDLATPPKLRRRRSPTSADSGNYDDEDDADDDSLLDTRPEPSETATNEIPRKAAKMLGFSEPTSYGSMPTSSTLSLNTDGGGGSGSGIGIVAVKSARMSLMLRGSMASAPQSGRKCSVAVLRDEVESKQQLAREGVVPDPSMQALHAGLARCISRLVATLRMTTEDVVRDGILYADEAADVDALFMRSLCEIVRCCEETGTGQAGG